MAATTSNKALSQYSGDTPSDLFIRDVQDWMPKLKRTDTPLAKMIRRGSAPKVPMLKLEWGWGSPNPDTDTVNEGGTFSNSDLILTVTNGPRFQVGQIIKIDNELLQVTAISGNNLTVTRGFGGTSAASHSDASTVIIMSPAFKENQNTELSPITQGEVDYNYFQQIEFGWQYSHRADVTPTYESRSFAGSRFAQELRKKMQDEAPVFLERTLINGQRDAGSTTAASAMGGIFQSGYNTTSNTSLSGPLTETTLMDNLQTVYNLVGQDKMGKTVMAHPIVCRIISSWYNDARRLTSSETSISLAITEIDTGWFGTMRLMPNYKFTKSSTSGEVAWDRLIVFNPDDYELIPYSGDSGWQTGEFDTDGWYKKGFLRGDFTLKAQNPDSRLVLGGFSVATADYPGI